MIYIRRLVWDTWNVAHIARHQVTPDEVEEICYEDYIVREGYKGRIILIGPTRAGRVLAVVLDSEGNGTYYVVTARPADRKERRVYREKKEAKPHDRERATAKEEPYPGILYSPRRGRILGYP